MAKKKDPAWLKLLSEKATSALWSRKASSADIELRNLLRRHKGFGNIKKWDIHYGEQYDEWGIGAPDGEKRVMKVSFEDGKQTWTFP